MFIYRILAVTALLFITSCAVPRIVRAQTAATQLPAGPLPLSLFPKADKHHYGKLTQKQFDCQWALMCNFGFSPSLHSTTGKALHRTGGWAQIVQAHPYRTVNGKRVKSTIAFEFVVSSFNTPAAADMPANRAAFDDFTATVQRTIHVVDAAPSQTFSTNGASSFGVKHGALTIWTAAYWTGPSTEVEALALCDKCGAAPNYARTRSQFLTAMHQLSGTAP
jgi:hypothetical protein